MSGYILEPYPNPRIMPQPALSRLPAVASRGVYCLPWIGKNGEVFLAAVDRMGQKVLDAIVFPGQEIQVVEKYLRAQLEEIDPKPLLKVL